MPADIRRTRRTTVRKEGVRTDSRQVRVRVTERERRPLTFPERSLIRKTLVREDPQWMIVHRRGVKRTTVGQDPLEARAVSEFTVNGFLHERIVYKWLTVNGFRPDVDFVFQSSQEGGRLDIGGMVVDFVFPNMKIALNVNGPQHQEQLRGRKDDEQKSILREMGYWSIDLDVDTIANAGAFEEFMRKKFVYGETSHPQTDQDPQLQDELELATLRNSAADMELALIRWEQWY